MSADVFTPKQVASALGVSESSVKRWVDSGRLVATKTLGGHRKVPLAQLVEFVRQNDQQIAHPEIVGLVASPQRRSLASLRDELFEALLDGSEPKCRQVVLGAYQRGEAMAEIGDDLVGPVFNRIGEGWEEGSVRVHEERRSCEVMMATLHELRSWLPTPSESAPLAVVATPLRDFAEVPARLVELTLMVAEWRVVVAGSGLPLAEVRDAVLEHRPRLFCMSATHLESPSRFPKTCNEELLIPLAEAAADWPHPLDRVVGGGALSASQAAKLESELYAKTLAELVQHQATLNVAA